MTATNQGVIYAYVFMRQGKSNQKQEMVLVLSFLIELY